MKKVKEENDLLKYELNQSIIERDVYVKEKLVCDVEKCDSVEVVCDKEYENVESNTISCDNKNVGWNIMKKMGYKGKGLGKD